MVALRSALRARGLSTALFALVGCGPEGSGGQTGGEYEPGGPTAGEPCDREVRVVSLDDATDLGFSATEVLAGALGARQSTVGWAPADTLETFPGVTLEYGPESGEQALTIEVTSSASEAELVHFVMPEPGEGEAGPLIATELPDGCPPDRLEIGVEVHFETGGGALDETFEAVLQASDPRLMSFSAELPLSELGGSFTASFDTENAAFPGDYQLGSLQISGNVYPGGTSGKLSSLLSFEGGGVAGGGFLAFARWPADDPCGEVDPGLGGDVPVPLTTQVGEGTAADALAAVDASSASSLAWNGGESTSLTLGLEALDVACVTFPEGPGSESPQGLDIPVNVELSTGDGLLAAQLPGRLWVLPDGSGFESLTLDASLFCDEGSPEASALLCGVTGLGLEDFDVIRVGLEASFAPDADGRLSAGEVVVEGARALLCAELPPESGSGGSSSPGCAGYEFEVAARGELGSD